MFKFIKVISGTVLDTINAVYHNKPLIFIRATFRKSVFYHHRSINEADSCLLIMKRTGLFSLILSTKCLGLPSVKKASNSNFRNYFFQNSLRCYRL